MNDSLRAHATTPYAERSRPVHGVRAAAEAELEAAEENRISDELGRFLVAHDVDAYDAALREEGLIRHDAPTPDGAASSSL